MELVKITVNDLGYTGINPVQVGFEDCESGHYYGPAVRTHWLIHFVTSGKGLFKIGENEYNIGAGEMFVIPPFAETYYEANEKNPWSYIWVGFTSDNLPLNLENVIKCPEAYSVFNAFKTADRFQNGRSAFIAGKLWELFAILLDKNTHKTDYVNTALDIIHSEYTNPITIEGIANRIGLDRRYFAKLFKAHTKVSPRDYLLAYRMKIASMLLSEKAVSVSVAANSVGYSDIFLFSKMFKKHFGIPPTEYKKNAL
ncbi:MAG: AraC family transcriptional regulator [Clostridia bacterium]|nr:AraC family transcriptional regulator [Clostridia bacterium]